MIKDLSIINFQSHKDTRLLFSKGVNVIVGTSDSGKTAILRALRLIFHNRPSGEAYRSTWGGNTKCSIGIDGFRISRIKTNTKNLYVLKNTGLENTKNVRFAAVKTSVPVEIEKALNISEINFQKQLDSPYLLSNTSGQVAAHFNKIAHLEVIDSSTKKIKKQINEISSQIKYDNKALQETKEKLALYSDLEKYEVELEVLESEEKQATRKEQQKTTLQKYIKQIIDTNACMRKASFILVLEEPIENILTLYTRIKEAEEKIQRIVEISNSIKHTEKSIKDKNKKIRLEKRVEKILQLFQSKKETKMKKDSLIYAADKLDRIKQKIIKLEQLIDANKDILKKNMPESCPFCASPLKSE